MGEIVGWYQEEKERNMKMKVIDRIKSRIHFNKSRGEKFPRVVLEEDPEKLVQVKLPVRLLCISDLHHFSEEELCLLKGVEYDACFFLGDISRNDLARITEVLKPPFYGVLGNHDSKQNFNGLPIFDLHNSVVSINGVRIAGIEGSNRYKNGDSVMHDQEEILAIGEALEKADILVSHDTGYQYLVQDEAHLGFKGIDLYLRQKKPAYHLFGHHHSSVCFQKGETVCMCVYRCVLFDFGVGKIQKLF